jgi:hypothetical protein
MRLWLLRLRRRRRQRRHDLLAGIKAREQGGQSGLLGVVHAPLVFRGAAENAVCWCCHKSFPGLQEHLMLEQVMCRAIGTGRTCSN